MRIKAILFVMFMAVVVYAAPRKFVIPVATGTNGVGSAIQPKLTGAINAIYISTTDGTSTGVVTVAYSPEGMSAVVMATNTVIGSKSFVPRVAATDTAGTALTNDVYVGYVLTGDDVTVSVTGAPASSAWKAVIVVK